YCSALADFTFIPIATITLQLERPWTAPPAMLMLSDDPGRLQFGQWLFSRGASQAYTVAGNGAAASPSALLHVVVSDARVMQSYSHEDIVAGTIAQISSQASRFGPMPRVVTHSIITEKRATFAATPGLRRPPNETPWPR